MDYFRFGHGSEPMVILPGLSVQSVMGAADAIAESYRPLADAYTVYVFDRRADLPAVYSVRDMARDTAQAFQALGLGEISLFGASQGGMIALVLAAEHPELVKKLAMGSSAARMTDARFSAIDAWIRLAKVGDRTGLYLAFGRAAYPKAVYEQFEPELIAAAQTVTDAELSRFIVLAKGTEGFDATALLDRICCPVLVLGSSDDRVLGADAFEELAQSLGRRPGCGVHLYEGYGHAAYDTAPDYRERLLRFFTS